MEWALDFYNGRRKTLGTKNVSILSRNEQPKGIKREKKKKKRDKKKVDSVSTFVPSCKLKLATYQCVRDVILITYEACHQMMSAYSPYNAAIVSMIVRFPLCFVGFFGKVVDVTFFFFFVNGQTNR